MRHSFILHTIATGVNCIIGSISQSKQEFNSSKELIILAIKAESTEYSLKSENKIDIRHNGSFFSHKKQHFNYLFNLPPLPDARRQTTMFCKIPNDVFSA